MRLTLLIILISALPSLAPAGELDAWLSAGQASASLLQETEFVCAEDYRPVCGTDGVTYNNQCIADEAGAEVEGSGVCGNEAGECPETYDPVCGINGSTFINECFAALSEVDVAGLGACAANGCPSNEDPVCGVNGLTYLNRCEAQADRVPVQRAERCDVNNCPTAIVPVCGTDGITYSNACHADREGLESYTVGACNLRRCPDLFVPVCARTKKPTATRATRNAWACVLIMRVSAKSKALIARTLELRFAGLMG